MKQERITAKLGSVVLTSNDGVVVGIGSRDSCKYLYFSGTEKFAAAIKNNHLKIKNWIISVADHYCLTKLIELPAVDVEQAFAMIEFELPAHIPISPDKVVYGCIPASRNESLLTVTVYAVKTNILADILQRFKDLGVRPNKVVTDLAAVGAGFVTSDHSDQAVYLLAGDSDISIYRCCDGVQKYSRIEYSKNDPASWKSRVHEILQQLREQTEPIPQAVKIAADKDMQQQLQDLVSTVFDDNPQLIDLPAVVAYDTQAKIAVGQLASESLIARGMLKAAQGADYDFLNLLPKEILRKRARRHLTANLFLTVLLSVMLIVGLWLNFAVSNWKMQRSCRQLVAKINPIQDIAAGVESRRQLIHAVQNQFASRNYISHILHDIYEYSPRQISISQVNFSIRDGNIIVNLRGQADTLSSAFEYSDAMKESQMLNNMQITNVQQIPRPGGSIVEFQADCRVRRN